MKEDKLDTLQRLQDFAELSDATIDALGKLSDANLRRLYAEIRLMLNNEVSRIQEKFDNASK